MNKILQGLRAGARTFQRLQSNQPSVLAELRAMVRQGREDFVGVLLGNMAGVARETGGPGTPTPQLVTQALTGKQVNPQTDRIEQQQPRMKQSM